MTDSEIAKDILIALLHKHDIYANSSKSERDAYLDIAETVAAMYKVIYSAVQSPET